MKAAIDLRARHHEVATSNGVSPTPVWEPRAVPAVTPTTDSVRVTRSPIACDSVAAQLVALLVQPVDGAAQLGSRAAWDEREREFVAYVGSLSNIDRLALSRRIDVGTSSDPLVSALARVNSERRGRLRRAFDLRTVSGHGSYRQSRR